MDITFQKLLSLGLDLERVGLMQREDNEGYFCTPRDAFLLGWAGVAQARAFHTEQSFGEFLTECRPDAETREVLETIGRGLDITPMPLPYKYLKELQDSFDMGAVPYTEEYYEVIG